MFFSVFCLLCLCARLFICALWSPSGRGLTSWLSFVVSNCEFVTFPLVSWVRQGFSLASVIGHSPKIIPDVREFAVQFGQFVRDDFQKRILYGNAQ